MTTLLNIAAVLAFGAVVAAFVLVGLRLFIPSEPAEPAADATPRWTRVQRRLQFAATLLLVLLLMNLGYAARFAFGAPHGERGVTVEVVEVADCHQSWMSFGLAQRCELRSFWLAPPESGAYPNLGPVEVIAAKVPEPGDEVARYHASGGWNALFLGANGTYWQPVEAEGRPNLVWLPTAGVLIGAFIGSRLDKSLLRKGARRQLEPAA